MRYETTVPIFGKHVVTIPKEARRRFGITEPKGEIKLVIEDYYPPAATQTETEIVREVKRELKEEKREEAPMPDMDKLRALAEEGKKKGGRA